MSVKLCYRAALEELGRLAQAHRKVWISSGDVSHDVWCRLVADADMADRGLPFAYELALRCAHGLTCGLTYALEYELLVSRRLQVERATTERVLAERERQYERSRENIEAINVKCHDIRHQIRRLAEGGLGIPRALRVARELERRGWPSLGDPLTTDDLVAAIRGGEA